MGGLSERMTSGGLALGTLPFARFAGDAATRAAWGDLLHRACDPNPFYGPDFLIPLAERLAPRADLRIAFARAGTATAGRFLCVLPIIVPQRPVMAAFGLVPRPIEAFVHPMVVDTTPLLDREETVAAAHALLALLAAEAPGRLLRLRLLRDGATAAALAEAAATLSLPQENLAATIRAGLSADSPNTPSDRRARDLRRLEKRIAQNGAVTFETVTGEGVAEALEAFLALEASGWKGRAATALACDPSRSAFARAALAGAARAPAIAIDLMRLDGRPIAAAVHIFAGGRAGTFKCAFDEEHARASPGVQLDAYTARALAQGRFPVGAIDSCAVPGHPVEALWPERLSFRDTAILLAAGAAPARLSRATARMARAEVVLARLKRYVKKLLRRKETAARG